MERRLKQVDLVLGEPAPKAPSAGRCEKLELGALYCGEHVGCRRATCRICEEILARLAA